MTPETEKRLIELAETIRDENKWHGGKDDYPEFGQSLLEIVASYDYTDGVIDLIEHMAREIDRLSVGGKP